MYTPSPHPLSLLCGCVSVFVFFCCSIFASCAAAASQSRDLYPFLVVNIGSGVSILKVSRQRTFNSGVPGVCTASSTCTCRQQLLCVVLQAKSASSFVRVTGTCIGGGTVLGLARLLFHAKSFRQVVRLSERGGARRHQIFGKAVRGPALVIVSVGPRGGGGTSEVC